MTAWDDERASITERRIDSNVPPKISSASLKDTRLALWILLLVPVIAIAIIWWGRSR
jgi:hypothetical protein